MTTELPPKYLYRHIKPSWIQANIKKDKIKYSSAFYTDFFSLRPKEDFVSFTANDPGCFNEKPDEDRIRNAFAIAKKRLRLRDTCGLYQILPHDILDELSGTHGDDPLLEFQDKGNAHWGMVIFNNAERDAIFATFHIFHSVWHPYSDYKSLSNTGKSIEK